MDEMTHAMFQTGSMSYLKFGDKKDVRPRLGVSTVPRLPSIAPARTTTNGLRKLQQHLESVREDVEEETDVRTS